MKAKEKENLKKRDRLVVTIIAIVLVIAIMFCIVSAIRDDGELNDDNQNSQTQTEENDQQLDGQIDYTKTENVEINGKVKTNISQALAKERDFEGMTVKNIKLVASAGVTNFLATVENTSAKDFVGQKVLIIFKNKDGSEYERLDSYLGDIKVGSSLEIDATTTADMSNAYDFELLLGE